MFIDVHSLVMSTSEEGSTSHAELFNRLKSKVLVFHCCDKIKGDFLWLVVSEDSVHGCVAPWWWECVQGGSHLMVDRKQRGKKGLGTRHNHQSHIVSDEIPPAQPHLIGFCHLPK
jgi:hypothetical protein